MSDTPDKGKIPQGRREDPDALPLTALSWRARLVWAVVLILLPAAIGHFFFAPASDSLGVAASPFDPDAPYYGRLTYPKPETVVGRIFKVAGETRNIPTRQQIVLVVDVPELNLCWPKQPFIEPNIAFQTEIFIGRPMGEIHLSLYAVDAVYAKQIEDWFASDALNGMWRLPRRLKLATLDLELGVTP